MSDDVRNNIDAWYTEQVTPIHGNVNNVGGSTATAATDSASASAAPPAAASGQVSAETQLLIDTAVAAALQEQARVLTAVPNTFVGEWQGKYGKWICFQMAAGACQMNKLKLMSCSIGILGK